MKLSKKLQNRLKNREEQGILRSLKVLEEGKKDFFSNDYLGYAKGGSIKLSIGSSGSRLISGTTKSHNDFEKYVAHFHQGESSLLFNSGYDANIGFFSSVPQKGDLVLYDALIHASIRDGLQLSNATNYRFKHNDLKDLEEKIKQYSNFEVVYVVVESVYSMDGDSPNFDQLRHLVKKYGIYLIIDEAHSFGVYGERGAGLTQLHNIQDDCFARLYTFGKALGRHGAVWVGSNDLIKYLINFARSFIYTTALSPTNVEDLQVTYQKLECDKINRQKLKSIINYYKNMIVDEKLEDFFSLNNSPIQSFFINKPEALTSISKELDRNGFLVKPIFSPTVPIGEERLRISLHSFNTFEEIEELVRLIKKNIKLKK